MKLRSWRQYRWLRRALACAVVVVGLVIAAHIVPALEWLGARAGYWLPNTVVGVVGATAFAMVLRHEHRTHRRGETGPLPQRPRLGYHRQGQLSRAFLWLVGAWFWFVGVAIALDGGDELTVFGPVFGTFAFIAGQMEARHGRVLESRALEEAPEPQPADQAGG
ncbi:hypothetical protein [Kocuria sp. KH4]